MREFANTVVKWEGFESEYVVAAVDGQRVERLAKVDGMEVHSVKIAFQLEGFQGSSIRLIDEK